MDLDFKNLSIGAIHQGRREGHIHEVKLKVLYASPTELQSQIIESNYFTMSVNFFKFLGRKIKRE